ncbi:MAG: hypothetical protein PHT77_11570 [Bacteroidales bacterium]|nr:hypothetical protein [Bacteroidales bacterium]
MELIGEGDGVFKVRKGNHDEKVVQVRSDLKGVFRRFTEDDGTKVVFVKV